MFTSVFFFYESTNAELSSVRSADYMIFQAWLVNLEYPKFVGMILQLGSISCEQFMKVNDTVEYQMMRLVSFNIEKYLLQ